MKANLKFEEGKGSRSGCIVSPKLFIFYMYNVIRKMKAKVTDEVQMCVNSGKQVLDTIVYQLYNPDCRR